MLESVNASIIMHKAYNVDTLSVKFALRNFYEMFYTLMSDPL